MCIIVKEIVTLNLGFKSFKRLCIRPVEDIQGVHLRKLHQQFMRGFGLQRQLASRQLPPRQLGITFPAQTKLC